MIGQKAYLAHVQEKDDRVIKRPMASHKDYLKFSRLVDIVGYMTTINDTETGDTKRTM